MWVVTILSAVKRGLIYLLDATNPRALLGVALAGFVMYLVGYQQGIHTYKEMADRKAKAVVIHVQKEKAKVAESNQATSSRLSDHLLTYTEEKQNNAFKIKTRADALVDKFTVSRVHVDRHGDTTGGAQRTTRVSTTTKTSMANVSDRWGFSGQDRATLIREAARADQAVDELNKCKAYVSDLYQAHADYQKKINEYNQAILKWKK